MNMAAPAMHVNPDLTNRTSQPLVDQSATSEDRNFAVAMHLSPFASLIGLFPWALLVPVVLWIIRKEKSAFNDDHGREIMNYGLSLLILHVLLAVSIIGILALPVLWVIAVVSLIRASIAAGRGEYFRYPMTWRFLS